MNEGRKNIILMKMIDCRSVFPTSLIFSLQAEAVQCRCEEHRLIRLTDDVQTQTENSMPPIPEEAAYASRGSRGSTVLSLVQHREKG